MLKFRRISKKIKTRLKLIGFIFLISVIPALTLIIRENTFYRNTIYNERKNSLKNHLNIAFSYIENVHQQYNLGEISNVSEAQSLALSRLKFLRYGPDNLDYFWVQNLVNGTPNLIMHPYFENPENIQITNLTQQVMNLVYQEVEENDEDPKEGFVEYNWPYYNDSTNLVPKLSFVKGFEAWGWIIGSGLYVNDIDEILREKLGQNIITIGGIYGVFSLIYISALIQGIRKQSETKQELALSESKYRNIVTKMNEGLIQADPKGKILYVNQHFQKMLGYSLKEYIGHHITEFLADTSKYNFENEFARRSSGYHARYELNWNAKNGTKIKTLITPTPLFDSNDNYLGSFGIITDITQIKKIQEDLYEKQTLLENTLENIKDGVIITNKTGNIVLFNTSATKITGWVENEVIGHNLTDVLHVYEVNTEKFQINHLSIDSSVTVNLKTKSNDTKVIALYSTPLYFEDKSIKGILVIIRDITLNKKFEQNLINIQKIESIQLLAASIGHDFNNFLTTILGNLSYIKFKLQNNDSETIEMLKDIEDASIQAKNLSNQLLHFTSEEEVPFSTLNLTELIVNVSKFSLSGKDVKTEFKISKNLYNIDGNKGQLQRVFQNLILNAVQAMNDKGIITFKAKNTLIPHPSPFQLKPGPYVELEIIDNGIGIHEDQIDRIFEPFFTTKKTGHGLGLSMCFSIIQNHNGFIYVQSDYGKGTNFHILLPKSQSEEIMEDPSGIVEKRSGTNRVLVLEDNPLIQTTFSRILNYLGFHSIIVDKGEEIISIYEENLNKVPFSFVILDLIVPNGMGGKEVIKKLIKINPSIKAIVTSGFSTDPVIVHYADYGFSAVLFKPFTLEDVSDALKILE